MGLKEKDNQLGENIILQTEITNKNELLSALNTTNTTLTNKERCKSAPAFLQDIFTLQKEKQFLVKKKSAALKGHISLGNKETSPRIPVVPGVAWEELLESNRGEIPENSVVTTTFLSGGFPGQEVEIHENNITSTYSEYDIIASTTITPDGTIDSIKTIQKDKTYLPKSFPEDHLLQKPPFRFVDEISIENDIEELTEGTQFQGTFTIPENFLWQNDGKIPLAILKEFAAQTGSAITSPYLNISGNPVTEREEVNRSRKFITLKSDKYKTTAIKAKAGDKFLVTGKILEFSPTTKAKDAKEKNTKSRNVKFCYTIENTETHEEILLGEISGEITIIKFLDTGYNFYKTLCDIIEKIGSDTIKDCFEIIFEGTKGELDILENMIEKTGKKLAEYIEANELNDKKEILIEAIRLKFGTKVVNKIEPYINSII